MQKLFRFFPVWMMVAALTGCIYSEAEKKQLADEGDKRFSTTVAWDDTLRILNPVTEGQRVEVVFGFTNTGEKPLVISNVTASCGCTIPEKPSEPVMPGKKGFIKAVFDSEGRPGSNHKTITVNSNAYPESSRELQFQVEVKPAAAAKV